MLFTRAALLALLVATVMTAKPAFAQEPLRIALFKTAADEDSLAELANALDPVVSSELSEVGSVTISARPALDLPSMQLAIDCVGETPACLSASAQQADADSLLAPSVTRDGDAIVIKILHFDPKLRAPRTAQRRYEGARIGEQALSGVGPMLAELFGEAKPAASMLPAEAPAQKPEVAQPLAAQPIAARSKGLPLVAILVGGVGVALIGTGIAFGVASNSSYDQYLAIRPKTFVQADQAMSRLSASKDQAVVSDITVGLGAAALVGAGVLLYWQLREDKDEPKSQSHVAFAPRIGPREVGLTLVGAWNDHL
jgi:hypothetical protein